MNLQDDPGTFALHWVPVQLLVRCSPPHDDARRDAICRRSRETYQSKLDDDVTQATARTPETRIQHENLHTVHIYVAIGPFYLSTQAQNTHER